jgi:hypothetical protein
MSPKPFPPGLFNSVKKSVLLSGVIWPMDGCLSEGAAERSELEDSM